MAGHEKPGMIRTVLKWVIIFFVIALIILWFWAGGWAATVRTAHRLTNPIDLIFGNGTSTGFAFRLPWQPDITQGPDISGYSQDTSSDDSGLPSDQAAPASSRAAQIRSFGNPSLYQGKVNIVTNSASENNPAAEYIQIEASSLNNQPITITGWSLQSAVSGTRVYIPTGAAVFEQGVINATQPIYLDAGGSAIITTGQSPVGTSFRENMCSGYLSEQRTFIPDIYGSCPSPSQAMPETADNLKTYGSVCFDYVNSLTGCHMPTNIPGDLSGACKSFVANTFVYNGCLQLYRATPSFSQPQWRVYLSMQSRIWNDTHDIVRLLDDQGRTVDVLTY